MAALFALALGLRLWGIGFGLPYEYHVDEPQYVRQGAAMGREGLKPTWWNNPPLFKYLLFAEYAGLYGVGRLAGWYDSAGNFAEQSFSQPTRLYLLGRATSALFGALTVLVVYWIGKESANRRVGLAGAGLLAVAFLHVRESHFAVNDAAATFFVSLMLLAAVRIAAGGSACWYVLGGAALGLGFATKYSAASGLVALLVAHLLAPGVSLWRPLRLGAGRMGLLLGAAAASAILASPYFVLVPGEVLQDIRESLLMPGRYGFDGWQLDPAGGYVFYLKTLVWGLGWGLLAVSGLGIVWAAVRHRPKELVLLSLPLALYLVMGRQRMYFARFALPMLPSLLVLAVALLDRAVERLLGGRRAAGWVLAAGVVACAAQPAVASVRLDALLGRTDTRTLAREWIEQELPASSRIATDWMGHPGSFALPGMETVEGVGLAAQTLEWYRSEGFEYLMTSSHTADIRLEDRSADLIRQGFYVGLDYRADLVYEVKPFDEEEYPGFIFDEIYGPAISLWQRERPGPAIRLYGISGHE